MIGSLHTRGLDLTSRRVQDGSRKRAKTLKAWVASVDYSQSEGEPACESGGKAVRGWDQCGQATKGTWGMSWRQEALKGVEDCEKLGGIVKRVLIPRFPNWLTLNP